MESGESLTISYNVEIFTIEKDFVLYFIAFDPRYRVAEMRPLPQDM